MSETNTSPTTPAPLPEETDVSKGLFHLNRSKTLRTKTYTNGTVLFRLPNTLTQSFFKLIALGARVAALEAINSIPRVTKGPRKGEPTRITFQESDLDNIVKVYETRLKELEAEGADCGPTLRGTPVGQPSAEIADSEEGAADDAATSG